MKQTTNLVRTKAEIIVLVDEVKFCEEVIGYNPGRAEGRPSLDGIGSDE